MKNKLTRHFGNKLCRPLNRSKWLFFAMPKCGSESVYPYARKLGFEIHDHDARKTDYIELYERDDLDNRIVFSFYRDPVERVYSAWRYLKSGGRNAADRSDLEWLNPGENFDDFVILWFGVSRKKVMSQIHFRSMSSWIANSDGTCVVDILLPAEKMSSLLHRVIPKSLGLAVINGEVQRRNKSAVSPEGRLPLSKKGIRLLFDCYSDDFKLIESNTGSLGWLSYVEGFPERRASAGNSLETLK